MRVVVLGGGITGLFASYYLRKKGYDVTIADKKTEVSSTSIYNAGLLTPSLAPSPPIGIGKIVSALFGPRDAIYISPREILRNPNWFITALRTGITKHENDILELSKKSLSLYEEFFASEGIDDVDLRRGVVGLYLDEEQARFVAKQLQAKFVGAAEIEAMGYRGFGGGAVFESEISVNPRKVVGALREKLQGLGVPILGCERAELKKGVGKIDGVVADGRIIEGDVFVVAAGSKCGELLRPLGYDPHVIPARGLVMLFESQRPDVVSCPGLLEDYGIGVIQHDPRTVRVTGFFELNDFHVSFSESRKKWLIEATRKHVQRFGDLRVVEVGVGYRPCTPDQLPVVGRLPGYNNGFVASGNCRLGMTLAPVTGRLLSSIVSGESEGEADEVKLLDPERFH